MSNKEVMLVLNTTSKTFLLQWILGVTVTERYEPGNGFKVNSTLFYAQNAGNCISELLDFNFF
jgi:hypothetical protein